MNSTVVVNNDNQTNVSAGNMTNTSSQPSSVMPNNTAGGISVPSSAIYPSVNVPATAVPIYIGNLVDSVHESTLHNFISSIGIQIVSARICRNNETKKSLNYGYINFQSQDEADQAMQKLNYMPLMGQAVRMMTCQRDPTQRRSGKGNIIVKNLPESVTHRSIYDALSKLGQIMSISLKPDPTNGKFKYACVQFEDENAAHEAVEMLNDSLEEGSHMVIAAFRPQKEEFEKQNMNEETFVNCYVKNLPKNSITTDEKLREIFLQFGPITSCKLTKDSNGMPTGAGFVCFENHESAKKAVEEGSKISIESITGQPSTITEKNSNQEDSMDNQTSEKVKHLIVCRFQRKNERSQVLKEKFDSLKIGSNSDKSTMSTNMNNNVYIKNLHPTVTDEILKEEFSKYGTVLSAKVMLQDDKISRGFGFVSFETPKQAENAIAHMHGSYFFSKPLHCELAQKKADRLVNLRNQFKSYPYGFSSTAAAVSAPANLQYFMKSPGSYFTTAPSYMSFTPPHYQPIYSAHQQQQHFGQQSAPRSGANIATSSVFNQDFNNAQMSASASRYIQHNNHHNSSNRMMSNNSSSVHHHQQHNNNNSNSNMMQHYDAMNPSSSQQHQQQLLNVDNSGSVLPSSSSSYGHNIRYNKSVRNSYQPSNNSNKISSSYQQQHHQPVGATGGAYQNHPRHPSSSHNQQQIAKMQSSSSSATSNVQNNNSLIDKDYYLEFYHNRLAKSANADFIKNDKFIIALIMQMQPSLIKEIAEYDDDQFYATASKILYHARQQA